MSNYKDNARICAKCAHVAKCATREEFLEKFGILDDLNYIIGSNAKIHCGIFAQKEAPMGATTDVSENCSGNTQPKSSPDGRDFGKTPAVVHRNYAVSIHQNSGKVKR